MGSFDGAARGALAGCRIGCLKESPVPGTFAVNAVPLVPDVTRNGPKPTDVLTPLGDRVSRTPGSGEKLFRNRQAIYAPEMCFRGLT